MPLTYNRPPMPGRYDIGLIGGSSFSSRFEYLAWRARFWISELNFEMFAAWIDLASTADLLKEFIFYNLLLSGKKYKCGWFKLFKIWFDECAADNKNILHSVVQFNWMIIMYSIEWCVCVCQRQKHIRKKYHIKIPYVCVYTQRVCANDKNTYGINIT